MSLKSEFERSGNWLFRKRSFVPLVLFPYAALTLFFGEKNTGTSSIGWDVFCLCIAVAGLLVRSIVIGYTPAATSGRNTEKQVAETVNTTGMYSMVRHPLYLGNFLMWLGPMVYVNNISFLVISCLLFWLYYERIMYAEESFLTGKFGDRYLTWAEKTPAFLPKKFSWTPTELPFSMKNVLKREYSGIFAMGLTFAFLNLIKNWVYTSTLNLEPFWIGVLVTSFFAFFILRFLRKKTSVLEVQGR